MATHSEDHAFPVSGTVAKQIIDGYGFPNEYLGLSKREYFAAMAMQGIVSRVNPIDYAGPNKWNSEVIKELAQEAVGMSDALIEALNDKNK